MAGRRQQGQLRSTAATGWRWLKAPLRLVTPIRLDQYIAEHCLITSCQRLNGCIQLLPAWRTGQWISKRKRALCQSSQQFGGQSADVQQDRVAASLQPLSSQSIGGPFKRLICVGKIAGRGIGGHWINQCAGLQGGANASAVETVVTVRRVIDGLNSLSCHQCCEVLAPPIEQRPQQSPLPCPNSRHAANPAGPVRPHHQRFQLVIGMVSGHQPVEAEFLTPTVEQGIAG